MQKLELFLPCGTPSRMLCLYHLFIHPVIHLPVYSTETFEHVNVSGFP